MDIEFQKGCLDDVDQIICETFGRIFQVVADHCTKESFLPFVPAFLSSEFCRTSWDTPYSRYQFHDPEESLEVAEPELLRLWTPVRGKTDLSDFPEWLGFTYRSIYILTGIPSCEMTERFPVKDLYGLWVSRSYDLTEEDTVRELLEYNDREKSRE